MSVHVIKINIKEAKKHKAIKTKYENIIQYVNPGHVLSAQPVA